MMANPQTREEQLAAGWEAIGRGDHGAAEAVARELLQEDGRPDSVDSVARNLLGIALMQQARHEEALQVLARALERDPRSAGTRINLGSALVNLRRYEEAVPHFSEAAQIEPLLPHAHFNLGHALKELARFEEAAAAYRAALAAAPDFLLAHLSLGFVLRELGERDAAADAFRSAVECDPWCAEAHAQLGIVRRTQGRLAEAVEHLERAVSIESDHFPALSHLGAAYSEQGRFAEAAACFERAVALDPASAEARHNLGTTLASLSRHDESIACFREALAIEPGRKYTVGALLSSKLQLCDWDALAAETAAVSDGLRRGTISTEPFALLAVSEDADEQRLCSALYYADRVGSRERLWKGERYGHGRIRVAYLSADFHEHPTAYLVSELIELHDRSRFEIFGASFGPDDGSATRARLVRAFDRFIDLRPLGDRDAARLLREAEIDIAVDLKGYTRGARPGILAHRPAPVQVGYLGYPGTAGADFLDYILADTIVLPREKQACFSERVVYLPDSYQVNDRGRRIAAERCTREAAGLPRDGFVFCCFNNVYKINPRMFDVWMRLLSGVPGSVLWLLEGDKVALRNLRKEARARGVDPDRLVFAPVAKLDLHLARQRCADLFLDTLPYNAHTTTSDALWAGLPVVTCPGAAFPGRVAASLLNAVGLPELVTRDLREYETLALELARDRARLEQLRARLARNRESAALFDTDRFRRHIESAYASMREIAESGEPPRAFAVDAIG
jgi:predicted O-linked N-acetylglucosamine transferase (SPINDLY family)